jgi:hypothetical protein
MPRYKGHSGDISIGGTSVGEVESFDLETSAEVLNANVMGATWKGVESGQMSATGSVSVLRDPTDGGQAAMLVGTKVSAILYPESNTTGLTMLSGTFLITSSAISVSVGDLVKETFSLESDGVVTVGTVA